MREIDEAVFDWFQEIHNDWLTYFFRDITSFGGPIGTTIIFLLNAIILLILQQFRLLGIETVVFLLTIFLTTIIKVTIDRPRPLPYDPDIHGMPMDVSSILSIVPRFPSFPSGHTCMSLVLYSMLGLSIGRIFPQLHIFLTCFGLSFPVLIGLSRLYLGAHWLSDVIGGYILGLIIFICTSFVI